MMLWLLPLVLALVLVLPVLLASVSRRADLFLSRIALPTFGQYVANESARRARHERLLRAAYVGGTHRIYASRTLLFAGLFGVTGSVFGVYLAAGVLSVLRISGDAIRAAVPDSLGFLADLTRIQQLTGWDLFVLLLFSSATVGAGLALGTYWIRWQYLRERADARAREIETTLPRTVAFTYALSRSGMPFPKVLDTLARNEGVYGEAARDIGIAVRDTNAFGTDIITALQRMATRTPSDGLEEFSENLASVLGGGRNLSDFLHEQYEHYQQEAEAQQEQYLELLSTFAEVYVTVFVAAPLFFITVLVIVGLVITDTLTIIRIVGYVAIPVASAGFIVYIDSMIQTTPTSANEQAEPAPEQISVGETVATQTAADGGTLDAWERNLERLAAYDAFRPVRRWIADPFDNILRRPSATLVLTVPIALVWVVFRVEQVPLDPLGALVAIDRPLVEGSLLVLGGYSIVYEVQKRRTRAIEDAIPDFLDRMASVNEAGLTVVESIKRVRNSDLGALTPEVQRTWRDIKWGANAETALRRLDRRTRTSSVTRVVTLITNAMQASGDIAPVLRIAAEEAQNTRRLRRERRQQMLTYQMVIYIAFLVFLGIIVALAIQFIPAVEAAGGVQPPTQTLPGVSGTTGVFGGLQDVNTEAYTTLFYHLAIIQAICSGLIAGQLGEGTVEAGLKHATILLALAYVTFLFI